jgi:hypothetical protein
MRAGGERVTAAGTSEPGQEPAVTSSAAVLFTLLCARSRFLFSTRLYEQGDGAAYAGVLVRFSGMAVLPASP